ncbi:hypothetical protein RFI_30365 [Reticulomyxa filosa]|uniref:Uncharacterized protein n=1 Tax=Reticulomyxa filosa TaxID=46433 RepID=X6LZI8_RETFI|nr:hypothetical protein RFI_30365 [Reticulomyxa filosa]|eukprot:ETO07024.1 hypothetical protein RFI_30365 [Reticulomyxa filosa]
MTTKLRNCNRCIKNTSRFFTFLTKTSLVFLKAGVAFVFVLQHLFSSVASNNQNKYKMSTDVREIEERIPLTANRSSLQLGDSELQDAARHQAVVEETKKQFMRLLIVCILQLLLFGSRQIVWILYARQFTSNEDEIGVVQFAGYFLAPFVILFMSGYLAPKIGYDYAIFVMSLLLLVGILLECLAESFWMLALGSLLAQQRIGLITQTYNAWILPLVESKAIKRMFLKKKFNKQIKNVAGLLSYAFSYRINFYINFGLSVMLSSYVAVVILGSQKKLEEQQLALVEIYNRYPLDGEKPKRVSLSQGSKTSGAANSLSNAKDKNKSKSMNQVGFLVSSEYRFPSALVHMQKMKQENSTTSVAINTDSAEVEKGGNVTPTSQQTASAEALKRRWTVLILLLAELPVYLLEKLWLLFGELMCIYMQSLYLCDLLD